MVSHRFQEKQKRKISYFASRIQEQKSRFLAKTLVESNSLTLQLHAPTKAQPFKKKKNAMPKGKESSNRHCSLCSDFQPLPYLSHISRTHSKSSTSLTFNSRGSCVHSIRGNGNGNGHVKKHEETWSNVKTWVDMSRWGGVMAGVLEDGFSTSNVCGPRDGLYVMSSLLLWKNYKSRLSAFLPIVPSDYPRRIARQHFSKQSGHSFVGFGWFFVQREVSWKFLYHVSWLCFANFLPFLLPTLSKAATIPFGGWKLALLQQHKMAVIQWSNDPLDIPIWEPVTITMMSHCSPSKSIPSTNFWSITRGKRCEHLNGPSSAWFLMLWAFELWQFVYGWKMLKESH